MLVLVLVLMFVLVLLLLLAHDHLLMARACTQKVPSMTSASDVSAHRTSSSSEWLHTHLDKPIVRTVLQRAAELLQIPGVIPSDFELQLVHYAPCAPSGFSSAKFMCFP